MPLTDDQRILLIKLVRYDQERRLGERIVPIPVGASGYVVHLRGLPSLYLEGLDDLDALCKAEVLGYQINRFSTGKLYHLTKESHVVVSGWLSGSPQADEPIWRWQGAEGGLARIPSTAEVIHEFDQTQRRLHHELVKLLPREQLPEVLGALTAVVESVNRRPPKAQRAQANLHFIAAQVAGMLGGALDLEQVGRVLGLLGEWVRLTAVLLERRKPD